MPEMRCQRWWRPVVSLLLVAAGCHAKSEEAAPAQQVPAGEAWLTAQQVKDARLAVAPLAEQDVGGAIVTSGRVTFDDLRVSHVFSPVTGRVTAIQAQPGQRVKRGAPLATIQSPDVGQAFSDLAKAQADLVAAEHDLKRQTELFKEHAAAQKDYEASQDNYGKAKAEFERAKKKAQLLRSGAGAVDTVTQEFTLQAVIDGEVIARNVNPGVEVQGQYGLGSAVELFTIGEIDQVWVLADLFEMDLARVKKGSRVTVQVVAYPNKVFEGIVDWVSGSLDPASRTAKVRCTIKNPNRELKPEMYATVSVSVAERKALAIPRGALLRLGDQTVVFVETGTTPTGQLKFERRPVAVDEDEGGAYLPVTHGLQPGDKIVTSGAILLSGMI
jgi:cobalt-zinc-cadmium efflux system membrane fusion protein